MILLGKWQDLPVLSRQQAGVYLGVEDEKVLLPQKQVPPDVQIGQILNVFVYKDSRDRLIATVNQPRLTVGETGILKVKEITGIGAFLDWGLEKDLLLPYAQQTEPLEAGFYYPVAVYVDKSERLAASMWIEKYLSGAEPDEKRRRKSLLKLEADAENVYIRIQRMGGVLPYNDKADPDQILRDFRLTKNAFKRAVGVLYKARRLMIHEDSIELL